MNYKEKESKQPIRANQERVKAGARHEQKVLSVGKKTFKKPKQVEQACEYFHMKY